MVWGRRLPFGLGYGLALAVAVAAIVGALLLHGSEVRRFERVEHREAARAARQATAVAARSLDQLATVAAFFQADEQVSRREFAVFAHSLLGQGALAGTAFIAHVPSERRAAFERSYGLRIREWTPHGVRPAAPGRDYLPLTFLSPVGPRAAPIGYDLGSDPRRAPVLARARDRGSPAATGIATMLATNSLGLAVFRPIYRRGAPTETVAQRRSALLGYAAAAFRARGLIRAAAEAVPSDIGLQLFEGDRPVLGGDSVPPASESVPLRLADRSWVLVVHDPSKPGLTTPLLVGLVGISIAALLGALVFAWSRTERIHELRREAGQDPLTGLRNRRRFEEELRLAMARSRRDGSAGAVLVLDLDGFKAVNDTLGHPAGDRTLQHVARALRNRVRATDVVARLGGDEFAVVLLGCDLSEARAVADAVTAEIRDGADPESDGARATVSIGIAMFGGDRAARIESVVAEADAAMYAAKEAGGNRVRVFDPGVIAGGDEVPGPSA
jgi:diguanylate cyclase (GGDEF)-like protein